jgi:tetratricopeptide (TPR) repeat protein/transcriptional regulator with XRE-family HTH domain
VFGQLVRGHRGRLGLTQEELAGRAGLGLRTLRDIESGRVARPRQATVRLLAGAFGLAGAAREEFVQAALRAGEPPTPPEPTGWPRPAQLPADVPGFAGRAAQLARLTELLRAADRGPAVLVTAIAGTAGVGKTALAVHWAYQVAGRFPDGQLYVDLRGFDPGRPALAPGAAIRGFLDALGVPASRMPPGLDAQAALYRSVLAGRRLLVVLDNARDADQVRPLLPGAAGCLVLVTSRDQLTGLAVIGAARLVPVDLLSIVDARELLAGRLGVDRVAAEPAAVAEIIGHCAGLPLALAVVAARAATRPDAPLADLAADLAASRGRLAALSTSDPASDLRAVFSWSYRTLSPGAARLFRLLGLHPGPDVAATAAASLAGVPAAEAGGLLAELVAANLLTEPTAGRYASHDLLRAYAAELAADAEPEPARRAAVHRLLDHYLRAAWAAAIQLDPYRDPIAVPAAEPGALAVDLPDAAAATGWFEAERAVLVAAVEAAAGGGFDGHAWRLAWALADHLDRRGEWETWIAVQRLGLAATERLGDRPAQASAHRLLANALTRTGELDAASVHYGHALDRYRQIGDGQGEARAHQALALLAADQGQLSAAFEHARASVTLHRAAGHRAGEADALSALGLLHTRLGRHQEGLDRCSEALALQRELGDLDGQAATLDTLGQLHQARGSYPDAAGCYLQAVALLLALGDRHGEATVLTHLGEAELAAGHPAAARAAWRRALAIRTALDHPDADELRIRLARPRAAKVTSGGRRVSRGER